MNADLARIRRLLVLVTLATLGIAALLVLPSAFFAIPWPIRKGFGWCIVGLTSWAALRQMWRAPAPTIGDLGPPTGLAERAIPWLLALGTASLSIPFLARSGNLGFGDWDLNLSMFESARRAVLEWGEFPWWSPWRRGGFPLAANPQCGVLGVAGPLVLAFGTTTGLGLATAACLIIAVEGARRLARDAIGDPWGSALAGLIYGLNGAVLVSAAAGFHLSMSYCALPWIVRGVLRLERSRGDAAALGAWSAFNVLNGVNYCSVYAFAIAGVLWLWRGAGSPSKARLLRQTGLALGVFLLLGGWRLATMLSVMRDFPRELSSGWAETFRSMFAHLLGRPGLEVLEGTSNPYFWETTCYIGPVALILAALSLRGGWRWWHSLALGCGLLAAGSVSVWHPSYWLDHFPPFKSMHVVTRWRVPAMLGVGLAAGWTVAAGRSSTRRRVRALAMVAVAAVAADYLAYGHDLLRAAYSVPNTPDRSPGPAVPSIVTVRSGLAYPAIARSYGVIQAQEPLLGYDFAAPTARQDRDQPGYVGEFVSEGKPVEPASWSPSRIEFRLRPGQAVAINQNPGSWWLVNGSRLDPSARCAEPTQPFIARADAEGRLELRIAPKGLGAGLALHGAGLALALICWRRKGLGAAPLESEGARPEGLVPG